jgi:hypothetical protein
MRINGVLEVLGSWNKGRGPIDMEESEKDMVWLTGARVRPWIKPIKMN